MKTKEERIREIVAQVSSQRPSGSQIHYAYCSDKHHRVRIQVQKFETSLLIDNFDLRTLNITLDHILLIIRNAYLAGKNHQKTNIKRLFDL